MTSQAIIIIKPDKKKDFLFKKLNGKMFLHYQLSYLAKNFFQKIVFIEPREAPPIKSIIGTTYMDMELVYVGINDEVNETEALMMAFEHINDIYAFVFDAHQLFRINFSKADDFRRMRNSKMIHIGKKSEAILFNSLPELKLNEKGQIEEINDTANNSEVDTYYTGTWLINKIFFQNQFGSVDSSLLQILKSRYQEYREFCLACRQYFIKISSEKDLENAENDIKEYHYQ